MTNQSPPPLSEFTPPHIPQEKDSSSPTKTEVIPPQSGSASYAEWDLYSLPLYLQETSHRTSKIRNKFLRSSWIIPLILSLILVFGSAAWNHLPVNIRITNNAQANSLHNFRDGREAHSSFNYTDLSDYGWVNVPDASCDNRDRYVYAATNGVDYVVVCRSNRYNNEYYRALWKGLASPTFPITRSRAPDYYIAEPGDGVKIVINGDSLEVYDGRGELKSSGKFHKVETYDPDSA